VSADRAGNEMYLEKERGDDAADAKAERIVEHAPSA
jgi:hypothetical protein